MHREPCNPSRRWALVALPLLFASVSPRASAQTEACEATVIEVRGDLAYLEKPPSCFVTAGARLGPSLIVEAVASNWILARVEGVSLDSGTRVALPPAVAATPGVVREYQAGPATVVANGEHAVDPGFWSTVAATARSPRPAPASHRLEDRPGPDTGVIVHGGLGAGFTNLSDFTDRDRGFWRLFADSSLRLDRAGAVAIGYRHRIRWQRRLSYDRTSQPWDDDDPQIGVHDLHARLGFLGDRLGATIGRFAPDGVAGASVVDGGALEGEPSSGLRVGGYGGLLPHPTSLLPDARGVGFGAFVRGRGTPGRLVVAGSLLLSGSTWKGTLDRTGADAMLSLRHERWLDFFLLSRLDVWTDHNPLHRPVVDLTRLHATARSRLLDRLDVVLHYTFVRFVPSLRTDSLWGTSLSRHADGPLSSLGATVRWSPVAGMWLSAEAEGDLDGPRGPGLWAGGGMLFEFRGGHDLSLRYRYNDADVTRSHHAAISGRVTLFRSLDLSAGYRFSWFLHDGGGAMPEHDTSVALDWQAWRRVFVRAEADWIRGDEVSALVATLQGGWRF